MLPQASANCSKGQFNLCASLAAWPDWNHCGVCVILYILFYFPAYFGFVTALARHVTVCNLRCKRPQQLYVVVRACACVCSVYLGTSTLSSLARLTGWVWPFSVCTRVLPLALALCCRQQVLAKINHFQYILHIWYFCGLSVSA